MGLELGPKTLSSPARRSRESIDKAEKILARVRRGRAAAAGSPTPAASPYRNVLRERVDTLHKRLSEGGAPTPAPDDDDAATLSPGGKLRAELSRRASERVAVAVSDMRQKLAELDGAAVPESDVARAVGELSAAVKRLGDDQARAHAIAAADRQRILRASDTALWRSNVALFLSAQLYALALGALYFSLPAGFFDAGGVALTS